jgi:hypothetical protein
MKKWKKILLCIHWHSRGWNAHHYYSYP